jgi:hypothetical protein
MLIYGPAMPNLNGPHGIGDGAVLDIRCHERNKIGRKYERYKPNAVREMIALNAVLEPTLIRASMQTQRALRYSALTGTPKVG